MTQPKLMIEPSSWLGSGIRLEKVNGTSVFRFTDALQQRSDELLERLKLSGLTSEE